MKRLLSLVVLLLCLVTVTAGESKDPLAPGNNLPSSFHPFNINEAIPPTETLTEPKDGPAPKHKILPIPSKHKFHCLISEYDLDPTVMLLARGIEDNAAFHKLLQDLDTAIDRNRKLVRLRAFVVFTYDDLNNLLEEDEKREEYTRKLDNLAQNLKLRNVVLSLGGKSDLAKYPLDNNALIALTYRKLKIVSAHKVPLDKVSGGIEAAAKAVLADVSSKLGATK
jgi:hypothetical protein